MDITNYFTHYFGWLFINKYQDDSIIVAEITSFPYLCGIHIFNNTKYKDPDNFYELDFSDLGEKKLILRCETTMTKEENEFYYSICKKEMHGNHRVTMDTPESIFFLINRGFDPFNLIQKGLALNYHHLLSHPARKEIVEFTEPKIILPIQKDLYK